MKSRALSCILIAIFATASSTAYCATNLNNSNASTVSLQTQCGSTSDCAESMYDLLTWIWGTKHPSAVNPLLVNIGPGNFPVNDPSTGSGMQFCNNNGYVTFRGAGRGTTTITGEGYSGIKAGFTSLGSVVLIKNCQQLSFEDLTISAPLDGDMNDNAIGWIGGGSSNWTNVEVVAAYYPWVDICASGSTVVGTHNWFSSSLVSNGSGILNTGYRSDCGISEIYGSKIFSTKTARGGLWSILGVEAGAHGHVEIYGSSVKVLVPANADPSIVLPIMADPVTGAYGQGGLLALDGGVIHMHGGVVSVRHEIDGVNSSVFGARTVGAGSSIHTPDTAYGMKASGSGILARVMTDGGMVMAPFQWPQGDTPPVITSANGADSFVETDCNASGVCDGVPTDQQMPHMMIYNANCVANGPWFDETMNSCRQ
ncbi:MAG: hypothetical protein HY941_03750 [Gammaproteobacteria bacterium]|nr:hypothetical protein [Gammaproteobacteria bacterium]